MPASADLIYSFLVGGGPNQRAAARVFALTGPQCVSLRAAMQQDAVATLGKACLSLADAFGSLERRSFSWACVKFYYCAFYSVKSWLFASDECHVYLDHRTPSFILARPGSAIVTGKGNSHEYAFDRFASRFSTLGILSQDVGPDRPFEWLKSQREHVQYLSPTFIDPVTPEFFAAWDTNNVRNLIRLYLETPENASDYATLFDPEHAMIALPLRLLADTFDAVRTQQAFHLSAAHLRQFDRLCRIGGHPISQLCSLVKQRN